ncbi:MAG: nuclear transport factor 2 family protein [Candidatus Heimdallarchaeota archaeon]|nr:nuclear transport factor 2 family protein [Candidatus Heimdallarchaeota archaeon]
MTIIIDTSIDLPQDDIDSIIAACKDYVDSWFTGDEEKMRNCLHPDLIKRAILYNKDTNDWIVGRNVTREIMVEKTIQGGDSDRAETDRNYTIKLMDGYKYTAAVMLKAHFLMDYILLGKFRKRWLIVSVLWEPTPHETSLFAEPSE